MTSSYNTRTGAFKPSYYTGTLVFCGALITVVMLLIGVLILSPAWRPFLNIFTAVFGVAGLLMVILMLVRIRKVESDYVKRSRGEDKSNKLLNCPDTHVAYARGCRPATNTLTADAVLLGADKSGRTLEYAAISTDVDVASARNRKMAEFLQTDCTNTAWKGMSWTSHKALCP
jgi:hypothetical protein